MMSDAAHTNGTLVDVEGVEKVFHRGSEDIHVLKDLHLKVPAGEFLALMGPSGSGKSTLLNLIGGLDRPTRGTRRRRGRAHRRAVRPPAGRVARPAHRLRVPALQPAAGAHGGAQRRAAAAAHAPVEGRAAEARGRPRWRWSA